MPGTAPTQFGAASSLAHLLNSFANTNMQFLRDSERLHEFERMQRLQADAATALLLHAAAGPPPLPPPPPPMLPMLTAPLPFAFSAPLSSDGSPGHCHHHHCHSHVRHGGK
jgi:hypothetical protein